MNQDDDQERLKKTQSAEHGHEPDKELYRNIEYWTKQEMALTQVPRQNVFEAAEESEE